MCSRRAVMLILLVRNHNSTDASFCGTRGVPEYSRCESADFWFWRFPTWVKGILSTVCQSETDKYAVNILYLLQMQQTAASFYKRSIPIVSLTLGQSGKNKSVESTEKNKACGDKRICKFHTV